MKLKKLFLFTFLLISCQGEQVSTTSNFVTSSNPTSSSIVTSDVTSFSENTSSLNSTSSESSSTSKEISSSSSSTLVRSEIENISSIRIKATALEPYANEVDVATSTEVVTIEGVLLNRVDVVTTKKGYGERYKFFIMDETGYIYVQVNYQIYSKLENSIGKAYQFKGSLSLYCHEPEIIAAEYHEINKVIPLDYNHLATPYDNVNDIHEKEKTMHTNCKGIGASDLISINVKYLGIHDDKLLLFSDGKDLILVHTQAKVKNRLTLNSSYRLYGTLNMFYYRPGLDYIHHETIEDIDTSSLNAYAQDIKATDLYKTPLYDKDNDKSNVFYTQYTSLYQHVYHFKGYVDYYVKDGKYFYVLLDNLVDHQFVEWTYTNASNNKALFLVNDEFYNLSSTEFERSSLYESYINESEVEVYFSLDSYNTQKYYQILVL